MSKAFLFSYIFINVYFFYVLASQGRKRSADQDPALLNTNTEELEWEKPFHRALAKLMRKLWVHHSITADVVSDNRQGLEGWPQLPRASLKPPASPLNSSPTARSPIETAHLQNISLQSSNISFECASLDAFPRSLHKLGSKGVQQLNKLICISGAAFESGAGLETQPL